MKRLLFISLFIFFPAFSKASIAVEPYAGLGVSCATRLGCLNPQKTYFIPSIGSRFGYGFLKIVMLGLDVSYNRYNPFQTVERSDLIQDRGIEQGMTQLQATLSNPRAVITNSLKTYNTWDVGPTLIIDLPLLFDGYATLLYSHSSHTELTLLGAGFKVGASYLSVPFVSVNVEFKFLNYFRCITREELMECSEQDGISGPMYTFSLFLSSPIKTGFL